MMSNVRNRILAVVATAVLVLCAGCNSNKSTTTPGTTSSAPAAQGAPSPLVRSHLAPKQVGTVPTGMHCHMLGSSPATYRPDPACTPGAVDEAVTQQNIDSTVCKAGYTATVRPPASATDKVKKAMYAAYGMADGTASELDHTVSLELGGANDVANLWPEPGPVPNPKDQVENALHKAVCTHKVTLAAAQQAIAADWTTALTVTGASR